MDKPTEDVVVTRPIYGSGIWALTLMQVCAYGEVPPDQVEAKANVLNPTGLSHEWRIIKGDEEGENKAPVRCDDFPERIHYLLVC